MARELAAVIVEQGIDDPGMSAAFAKTVARLRRDNRFATLIFALYRWFFTSGFLSRSPR